MKNYNRIKFAFLFCIMCLWMTGLSAMATNVTDIDAANRRNFFQIGGNYSYRQKIR